MLLLAAAVSPAYATGFYKDFVITKGNSNGGATTVQFYNANATVANFPAFQGANLGTYDRGNGNLSLEAEANTFSDNGDDVQAPQMYYRVYLQNSTPGAFAPLNLTFASSGEDGNSTNEKWTNLTTNPNLLASTNGPGTYVLEVYFQGRATYNNSGGSGEFPFYDSRNSQNYQATFTVTGSVPAQWNGSANSDWFTAANWSTGKVPDPTTDATITFITGGNNPIIASGLAQVRTLTLINGTNAAPGATTLTQHAGELQVYGDFNRGDNPNDPTNNNNPGVFYQTGGTFTLAGGTQVFDGATFFNFNVQGGMTKTLRTRMDVLNILDFVTASGGGVIVTDTRKPSDYSVDLDVAATIMHEDENNYVLGILRSINRNVQAGETNSFGGIGLDLTAVSGSPNAVVITRVTGPSGFTYQGAGTSHSIRRGFIIQNNSNDALTFNLVFHYLQVELSGILESNLVLFRTPNGTTPFEALFKTSANTTDKTVTRLGITGALSATFTLGDAANPLPVTLASFTATATPKGTAQLRWVTASETNNRGFGIERQLEGGSTWQQVGYVAGTNQANGSTYSYLDEASAGAATKVYYRLRQEDQDGTATYSPVATVAHIAASAGLALYPVPAGDNLSVSFAEAGQAGSEVTVTNMQGQQVLRYLTPASTEAALSLPVQQLAAGVYVLSVRVPGQAAQHARFTKL